MTHPALEIERSGLTLTFWLNAPQARNAQTPSLWAALADAAAQVPDDVRVVLLRGRGPDFSAGLHRGMLAPGGMPGEPDLLALAGGGQAGGDEVAVRDAVAGFQRAFTCWRELPQPVVAVVQGHAVGAGFQLALAADLRIAADDAVFAMREVTLGLVPDLAGTTPLARLVGPARAFELCATGRPVHAEEAARIGLVNTVVPSVGLDAAVDATVAALLAAPDRALREVTALMRAAGTRPAAEQEAAERAAQARLLTALATRATTGTPAEHAAPPAPSAAPAADGTDVQADITGGRRA